MAYEGTEKYFFIIFLIFFIVYIIVKVCLSKLFKEAKISGWKAYIPIYNKKVLVEMLELKKSVFYKTLIPIGNLYYYYIIISRMLEVYNMNKKEAIWFLLVPAYKFPELILKKPQYRLHMYDDTEEFIQNENTLFVDEKQNKQEPQINTTVVEEIEYNQMPDINYNQQMTPKELMDNVFNNSTLEPDKKQETYIEAKKEEIKEEVNPIMTDNGKPRVCPNCGTKVDKLAKVCFFCGKEIPWHKKANLI